MCFFIGTEEQDEVGFDGRNAIRNLGVGNVGVVGDFGADGTQVIHTQRMDIIMSGNPGEHRQLLLHHMEEIGYPFGAVFDLQPFPQLGTWVATPTGHMPV